MTLQPSPYRAEILIGNDNLIILSGLKNKLSGSWITSATVTATLKDSSGNDVTGAVNISLAYTTPASIDDDLGLAADGNFVGTLEDGVSLTENAIYTAHIDADAGSDLIGHWEVAAKAVVRSE